MKKVLLLVFLSLTAVACKNAESRDQGQLRQLDFTDKGGLFKNFAWYSYDMSTHSVWSNLDIYAIRSKGQYFVLEILSYNHPSVPTQTGYYTLRIRGEDNVTHEVAFDASACGNPHVNPNYATCMTDPDQNAFVYLKLSNRSTVKMSDLNASTSGDWDIGFKTTSIKLNAGTSGVGDVAGALYYRNSNFFDSAGNAKLAEIQNAHLSGDKHLSEFNSASSLSDLRYYVDGGTP